MKRKDVEWPPMLLPLLEELRKEGIYLSQDGDEVKSAPRTVEEKAVQAVNEALRQAALLNDCWDDLSQGARILEKIQIAVAEAERAAFVSHGPRAQKSLHVAQRIVSLSRELFHEMKEKRTRKKAA